MNLDHNLFQESKLSEDRKKRSSPKLEDFSPNSIEDQKEKKRSSPKKLEDFFPSNSSEDQRSDADQSHMIGGGGGGGMQM